jgi:DNA adenine methylase
MSSRQPLKAPFPYAGGKRKVADQVWSRFGNVDNYIEPFCGSAAVLFRRPASHFKGRYRTETVNDASHYIVNFWRSVKADPEAVAKWADSPVIEADLHARHRWLVRGEAADGFRERMSADPEYFDPKFAGWWCWGACCWIGSGWCEDRGVKSMQRPDGDGDGDKGILGRPQLADQFDLGRGVNSTAWQSRQIPILRDGVGQGVVSIGVCGKRHDWLAGWMRRLSDRLRQVRTCYGHWSRICDSDSTMTRLDRGNGVGVFLDPPYPTERGDTGEKSRDGSLYINDTTQDLNALRDEVLEWCRKWGGNPSIKIAVCGYEGDGYEKLMGDGWDETAWEANGGYANQRRSNQGKAENANRERIWWSPACIASRDLFAEAA